MNEYSFTNNDHAFGIRVLGVRREGTSRWYWRHVDPAPMSGWRGPYESAEQAHSAAVSALLSLAHSGRQALSTMELNTLEPAQEDVPAPSWWNRVFDS